MGFHARDGHAEAAEPSYATDDVHCVGHASAMFLGKIWVVGGQTDKYTTRQLIDTTRRSDVWTSIDGNMWRAVVDEAPFPRRFGHSLTVFPEPALKNTPIMVLMGGFSPIPANDIWYTRDGQTWEMVTYAVPWSPRGWHCAFVFNQRFWVAGGTPLNNEVWSTDSIVQGSWKQMATPEWSPRAAHSCVNHQVKNATVGDASTQDVVFLLAGWGRNSELMNDVWSLDKSNSWTQQTAAAPWPARAWTAAISFNSLTQGDAIQGPRLWMFGGGRIGNGVHSMFTYSDVWVTRDGESWIGTSSDRLGQSTVEWCQVTMGDKKVCFGKWGHSVVLHQRNLSASVNVCGTQCTTNDKATVLSGTLIGQCNSSIPPPAATTTSQLVGNLYQLSTQTSDGCGTCATARYYDEVTVPAVLLIAGSSGDHKVSDVFRSTDFFLCEIDGQVCGNQGYCGRGGVCVCDPGWCGDYCQDPLPPSKAARVPSTSFGVVWLVVWLKALS
ncbi:hypothetical protein H310_06502 [Aphanomyces invadans]|uniref:EGF-like domain-containing protein n=1 Tax=Aphanomyces invadans TaxID=157072 RepID=A0A024U6E0_9STRA|nr:hypothetical protein H310_06502 [Aphanomyces invadans]ETW01976.1 hypothetical protein H310_06502 [Aphanomyces invadans]|eukprot:XP_008869824.1 hypothetical protein H310_06502 [Aphanomyces invadans]